MSLMPLKKAISLKNDLLIILLFKFNKIELIIER